MLTSNGPFLPRESSDELFTLALTFLLDYSALARKAIDDGRKLWNVVPKFHHMYHLAYFGRFQNPRLAWVFRDEDFVGRVSRIGHSCTFGVPAMRVPEPVIKKWRQNFFLRMARRRDLMG